MKDITVIKKEINELLETDQAEFKKAQLNRIKAKAIFLKTCLLYLETEPDSDYLKKEKNGFRKGLIK